MEQVFLVCVLQRIYKYLGMRTLQSVFAAAIFLATVFANYIVYDQLTGGLVSTSCLKAKRDRMQVIVDHLIEKCLILRWTFARMVPGHHARDFQPKLCTLYQCTGRSRYLHDQQIIICQSGTFGLFQSKIQIDFYLIIILLQFVGRLIAKAIYDNKQLDCYFTRAFYKHILNIHGLNF